MREQWIEVSCEHCGVGNWVCLGDMSDLTVSDVEVMNCYKCKKKTIIIEEIDDWLDHSEYESVEDMRENGYARDGQEKAGWK